MAVAVWDTYVAKKDGNVLHFDIITDAALKDPHRIYEFGKEYLAQRNEADAQLSSEQCQFCHIEEPGIEMKEAIAAKGYYILEMEEIPATLGEHPTRRELILFLRAHHHKYRFFNFQGITEEQLKEIILSNRVDREKENKNGLNG